MERILKNMRIRFSRGIHFELDHRELFLSTLQKEQRSRYVATMRINCKRVTVQRRRTHYGRFIIRHRDLRNVYKRCGDPAANVQ